MKEISPHGNYRVVSNRVREILDKWVKLPDTISGKNDTKPFRELVQRGFELFPERYHPHYLQVLSAAIDEAEESLDSGDRAKFERTLRRLEEVFSNLAAPIEQLDSNSFTRELKAYLAVISSFYQRFVDDQLVSDKFRASGYLPELSPLGFFVDSDVKPFAVSPSSELPVAFIAKPVQWARFAPLFIIDGHEVGGHVFQSAIARFADEVESNVRSSLRAALRAKDNEFYGKTVNLPRIPKLFQKPFKRVGVATFVNESMASWSHEFFSDICGVLNLGPAYINGLILILANSRSPRVLSSTGSYAAKTGLDSHPVDLLRVLVCLKVLELLNFDGKDEYLQSLTERFKEACKGRVPEKVSWKSDKGASLLELSLDSLEPVTGLVAESILNTSFKSLGNRSLLELMTWGDKDEALTSLLSSQLLASRIDENLSFEARHLVSASVLAMEQLSEREEFESSLREMNETALDALASLFEEQCLLCEIPEYTETRRQDFFQWSNISESIRKLFRRR